MTAQFVDEEDKPYPRWNEILNNEAIDCINEALTAADMWGNTLICFLANS